MNKQSKKPEPASDKEKEQIRKYWDSVYNDLSEEEIWEMERQFFSVEEKCSMDLPHEFDDI